MYQQNEFEILIRRFSYFIQAHIQKYNPQRNGIDPQDIAQEIQLKLWKVLKNNKKIHNYSSYIKKVINSTVIDHIRKSRRNDLIINAERHNCIKETLIFYRLYNFGNQDLEDVFSQALKSLISSRQKVVRLYLLDMTIDEISIYLNWSKNKTRNLLYRGLSDLKKYLKGNGICYEDKH